MANTTLTHTPSRHPVTTIARHAIAAIALALLACSLTACAGKKETVTYYAPSSLGIKTTAGLGPANQAEFDFPAHGVRMMLVAQPSHEPARIWLSVHVPQGQTLRLLSDSFTITPKDKSQQYAQTIDYTRGTFINKGEYITHDFQTGQLLEGASTDTITRFWGKPVTIPRQYEIVSLLTQDLPDSFRLTLPEIEISGQKVKTPVIHFSKQTGQFKLPNDSNNYPW